MATFLSLATAGMLLLCAALNLQAPEPRFEAQVIDDEIAIGYGLAIGDVDGDGKPDILLADQKQFVWYRNGDWERFVMAENLTERDNVAIAAEDIDGDGQVEVAVGARWNPGETSDAAASGSVHYLIRPADPTQPWEPVELHHEPTIHRMRWVRMGDAYRLVVLPLHGRGNEGGEGAGVRVLAYEMPEDPREAWNTVVLDSTMHMTHNFDVLEGENAGETRLYIGGREGVHGVAHQNNQWAAPETVPLPGTEGVGEVRMGRSDGRPAFITTIEPMHGNQLAVYSLSPSPVRQLLDDSLGAGHALAAADLLGLGQDQIVAGWREPNAAGKVGIKLYVPPDTAAAAGTEWAEYLIDDDAMAAEDLKVADLDGDGRLDIIAAGRATHNLVIYWNRTSVE
ncbi:MAG: FG-GAP repeat domain-containing protein [Rhodothermales bacterium]